MDTATDDRENVTIEMIEDMVMKFILDYRGGNLENFERLELEVMILRALKSYPNEYLPVLKHNLETLDPDVAFVIAKKIASGHDDYVDLNEYAYFLPRIKIQNKLVAEGLLLNLRDYMHGGFILPAWDYSKTDEEVRGQCIAIMNVAAAIFEISANAQQTAMSSRALNTLARITDKSLVEAVVAEPETADRICEVIRSYNVSDYLSIRGILDGFQPSLISGNL